MSLSINNQVTANATTDPSPDLSSIQDNVNQLQAQSQAEAISNPLQSQKDASDAQAEFSAASNAIKIALSEELEALQNSVGQPLA